MMQPNHSLHLTSFNHLDASPVTGGELACAASKGQLYAVLDAHDNMDVAGLSAKLPPDEAQCLYGGAYEQDYAVVAPHLFKLSRQTTRTTIWQKCFPPTSSEGQPSGELATQDAGFFCISSTPIHVLRQHWKYWLRVVDQPTSASPRQNNLFRFYSPPILKSFLQASTAEECQLFFGPIDMLIPITKYGCHESYQLKTNAKVAAKNIKRSIGSRFALQAHHYEAFNELNWLNLLDEFVMVLQQLFPDHMQRLSPPMQQAITEVGMQQARQHGFINREHMLRYCALHIQYGGDFVLEDENISRGLGQDGYSAGDKIDQLEQYLSKRPAKEAA